MPIYLSSCTVKSWNPGDHFKSLWWTMKLHQREAGDQLIVDPNKIWRKLRCERRHLPYVQVDDNEIIPLRVIAGEKLNHHLVYSMCPSAPSKIASTRLTRYIYFRGNIIFKDVSDGFELKPGRWSVDAFVTVSKQAQEGIYSFEMELKTINQNIRLHKDFIVVEKEKEDEE